MPGKLNQKEFFKRVKEIHGDKYDYSLVEEYKSIFDKITIICPQHGVFQSIRNRHLHGGGCPKCAFNRKLTNNDYIEKVKKIHKNKYDYSKTVYKNAFEKVIIICPIHGEFKQIAGNHKNGSGCPKCYSETRSSKGEEKIQNFLEKNNIIFEKEKQFSTCRGKKRPLPFDFYIPSKNLLIEFQGEQHFFYKNIKMKGQKKITKEEFELRKKRDEYKKQWVLENNYNFLEIKYNDNVEEKLQQSLIL